MSSKTFQFPECIEMKGNSSRYITMPSLSDGVFLTINRMIDI